MWKYHAKNKNNRGQGRVGPPWPLAPIKYISIYLFQYVSIYLHYFQYIFLYISFNRGPWSTFFQKCVFLRSAKRRRHAGTSRKALMDYPWIFHGVSMDSHAFFTYFLHGFTHIWHICWGIWDIFPLFSYIFSYKFPLIGPFKGPYRAQGPLAQTRVDLDMCRYCSIS